MTKQNTLFIILISLFLVNCKDGGGGSGGGSSTTDCKLCGDYISNEYSDLGEIAQYLVDNDAAFNDFYFATNAGNGLKTYPDMQILWAIRGFVNAKAKAVDGQGEMIVPNETAMGAFLESTWSGAALDRGVSREGLCYLMADIYDSFGINSTVILITGTPHTVAPNGQYCLVEAHLPNGDYVADPFLNRSYGQDLAVYWENAGVEVSGYNDFSSDDLLNSLEAGLAMRMRTNPDGMAGGMPSWLPGNDYFQTYENLTVTTGQSRDELVAEMNETVIENITRVAYEDIR